MSLRLASALLVTALVLPAAGPAFAQTEEDVYQSIENIHGDADGFFEVFAALQDAVMMEDYGAIGGQALYPLLVNADGESVEVQTEGDLLDSFDDFVWPETLDALANQDIADLIVTQDGVGIGNGAIWVTNVCLDESCEATQWGIIAINN